MNVWCYYCRCAIASLIQLYYGVANPVLIQQWFLVKLSTVNLYNHRLRNFHNTQNIEFKSLTFERTTFRISLNHSNFINDRIYRLIVINSLFLSASINHYFFTLKRIANAHLRSIKTPRSICTTKINAIDTNDDIPDDRTTAS